MKVPPHLQAEWSEFCAEVESRLAAGAKEYGDSSLTAKPSVLAAEMEQEAMDIFGWGFILWRRVRRLKAGLDGPL